jgi:2-dehydropantoate 2-reductase
MAQVERVPDVGSDDGPPLRIAVLGPGAVGGLVAALLARTGDAVTCLAATDTVTALRERGIRVESELFGSFSVPVRAAEQLDDPVDVCFVTVKATQLDTALSRLPATALGSALLVPLLNGVEHVAELRRLYPAATVVAASLRVESSRTGPGQIHQVSPFASLELASVAPAGGVFARLAAHLRSAGFDVTVRVDEIGVLWDKLAFLAPFALLTTHSGSPAGMVRTEHRDELRAVIAEVSAVALAEGAGVDGLSVLAYFDSVPASMQSSMWRDSAAGLPTEVEAIGGAVLRKADSHGIATPVTARLVDDLRSRSG